jgi:protein involved in polysaccharide export with SLBB domain
MKNRVIAVALASLESQRAHLLSSKVEESLAVSDQAKERQFFGRWKTAIASCMAFCLLTPVLLRAQTGCDPTDPSTCGTDSTTMTIPSQGATGQSGTSYGNQGGSAGAGNLNLGGAQTNAGFNPATGFAASPNYTDKQNQNNSNDWWQQYRFNPDRALRLAQQTEFQKMVLSSTGRNLPLYGADLFWGSPSTFAPVEQVPVTPDYVVGPGDELVVHVWGQVSVNATVTVDRTGMVYLPQVGPVAVAGIPFSQLQTTLQGKIAKIYRNFNVSVSMGQLHSIRIYVSGEARQPGSFTVSSLSTLVNALFVTGGPAPQGSFRHIQLRRAGQVVTDFDLYDLLIYGDKSKDVSLLPGDVIYIPPVGPQAAVFGSVRNSAIYELKDDTTVAEVVKDAGGLSILASLSNAVIERITDQHERTTVSVSMTKGAMASTVMHDGDILRIMPITPRFSQTITMRGNLADPGRFGWHEGMRLSELIPDSAALVTRNYWQKRNHAGIPSPDFEPDPTQRYAAQPANYNNNQQQYGNPTGNNNYQQGNNSNSSSNNQANANYSNNRNTNGGTGQNDQYQQLASQMGSGGGTATNPSLPDCPANVASPEIVTGQQTTSTTQQIPGVTCNIRTSVLGGTTLADQQGRTYTENTAGADRINDVHLPAPDIDWSYAVIERLDPKTFRTTLIPFDLGKLVLAHDPSQDLALEPGDIITIFSEADIHVPLMQQTKLVRLEGEVVHAGIYSVQPGETLRDVVQRAGGLTPNAYLFGSEFTRASTRVAQQARLDDYVSTLEIEMDRAAVASSANALSAQDTASSQATLSTTQLLVSRLKLLRASGRIVLNLKPTAHEVSELPALTLQDGDRLVIPAVPPSVNVVGAVYYPSSFLYNEKGRVMAYLQQAGGPNRDADRKHVFIVRADGAVLSKEASTSFWGNTFKDEGINPGDTIVVPEKVYKGSSLRAFSNYAQLFSSVALGIAYFSAIQ